MTASLAPGLLYIAAGLVVPLLPLAIRRVFLVLVGLGGVALWFGYASLEPGSYLQTSLGGYDLTLLRVDKLSLVFSLAFAIAALLSIVFSLHIDDSLEHSSALIYVGATMAAVFAGDLVTLFIFWELTALASAFVILARRTERAYRAVMRYIVIQVSSGLLLLLGILLKNDSDLSFGALDWTTTSGLLIFLAFGIKAAFPLLHNWLQDAYPESSSTGMVFLSAFTTKLAIYALARSFAGTEILIPIGVAMTLFPIFFIENDLRKTLAYSLNNQLGFMVTGIGIGTDLAVNGAVAHAFAHIQYKALLLMSMGAVLYRTGTVKATELGGLARSMPFTAACCLIAAASISAFPLFSGFTTKSMILSAAGYEHLGLTLLLLMVASVGVLEHVGIKVPYLAFFGHDSGKRPKEAPLNMLIAMGTMAALCIGIGIWPEPLYRLLPNPVDYTPYSAGHIFESLQILVPGLLAFLFLLRAKLYPEEVPSINLDSDWLYRKLGARALHFVDGLVRGVDGAVRDAGLAGARSVTFASRRYFGPTSIFARTWTAGETVLWVAILLALTLLFYYR